MPLPVTLGHEIMGTVVEVGPDVTRWMSGDQVAAYVIRGCGNCRRCARGEDNLCQRGEPGRNPYLGLGTHFDGGMADYVALRADAVADAAGLDLVTSAPLTDAGLTALHAINSLHPAAPTQSCILVIGVGGLGHLGLQILAHRTDAQLLAVDRNPASVELALKLGAHQAIAADGDETAAVLDMVDGRNVTAVLDFVGVDSTLSLGAAVTNRGGQIVVAGLGGGQIPFQATSVSAVSPEVSLKRVSAGTRAELVEVLDLGRIGAVRAETKTYPLDQAAEAIAAVEAGSLTGRAVLIP